MLQHKIHLCAMLPVPISESMTVLLVTHRTHTEAQPQQGRAQARTAKIPKLM